MLGVNGCIAPWNVCKDCSWISNDNSLIISMNRSNYIRNYRKSDGG